LAKKDKMLKRIINFLQNCWWQKHYVYLTSEGSLWLEINSGENWRQYQYIKDCSLEEAQRLSKKGTLEIVSSFMEINI